MNDMNNKPGSAAALFSGVQWVNGLGWVGSSAPNALGGPLGDDASVMMISGTGNIGSEARSVAVNEQTGVVEKVTGAAFTLKAALTQPVRIGSVELPLWAWLLIGGGILGAAGYYLLFHKKK